MDDSDDVVVIGGGLAGLAAAATAATANSGGRPRVLLLDGREPGGRARSDRREGFLLNQGPHAVYEGGAGLAVLRRLGVEPHGGPPPTAGAHGWRDGELLPLPSGGGSLVRTRWLGVRSRAQLAALLARLPRIRAADLADRSTAAWLAGLGLRDDAHGLVEMLVRVATYGDDLGALSADAGARQLQLAFGSGVRYCHGGWQSIVDALCGVAADLGVDLRPHAAVTAVEPGRSGYRVHLAGNREPVEARAVVLAGLAPGAVARVVGRPLADVAPPSALGPPSTAACLDLGLRRPPSPPAVFGIGAPLYLSTHCPPAQLAPAGHHVVHALRYGARDHAADRAELDALVRAAGVGEADVVVERFLASMTVHHGAPVPGGGLRGRPGADALGTPGLFLAGDWVGPTGLLADAALASGELAGREAARHASALAAA